MLKQTLPPLAVVCLFSDNSLVISLCSRAVGYSHNLYFVGFLRNPGRTQPGHEMFMNLERYWPSEIPSAGDLILLERGKPHLPLVIALVKNWFWLWRRWSLDEHAAWNFLFTTCTYLHIGRFDDMFHSIFLAEQQMSKRLGIERWPVMNIWWLCPKFFYWHGTLGIATRCVEKLIKTLRSQHVTFACVWYTLPNKWKIGSPQKNIQTCGPQIPHSVASWACSEIEVQPQWTTGIGTEVTRCGTFWMQHDARKTARRRWDKKSYQKGWVHVESVLGH